MQPQYTHCTIKTAFLLTALALFVQGCGLLPIYRPAPGSQEGTPYVPATEIAQTPSVVAPTLGPTPSPSPTVPCVDNLAFISDITIEDGTQVQPGAILDKRWQVRNYGTCNWGEGYTLRLSAGDQLTAENQLPLFPARAGTAAEIQIEFQAPFEPGSYRSAWQAYNPQGEAFGDQIFLDIEVIAAP